MDNLELSILFNKYNEALISIKDRFDLLYKELSILGENNPIEHIKYRVKKPDSIVEKLFRLSVPFSLENVENTLTDIIGVRIVCSFLSDLEKIKTIIKQMEQAGELKIITEKDYVTNPKESGYSSYHMIVKMPVKIRGEIIDINLEIQIRTIAMDMSASLEHKICYKKNPNSNYKEILKDTSTICEKIDKELNKFISKNEPDSNQPLHTTYPFMYKKDYKLLKLKYEAALKKLENKVNNIYVIYEKNKQANPIEHIKTRIKDEEKIIRKLLQSGKDITVDNIKEYVNDIAGIKIVCSFKSNLEELKEIILNDDELIVLKEKDYVTNPKESGYTGYHLLVGVPVHTTTGLTYVKVEIQIRTIAMEMWASLEQKICYHKTPPENTKNELKRLSRIITVIDNEMDKIITESTIAKNDNKKVKKLERIQ